MGGMTEVMRTRKEALTSTDTVSKVIEEPKAPKKAEKPAEPETKDAVKGAEPKK